MHEQLSGSRDDDNRAAATGEARLQLRHREPAGIAVRILRIGLVDDGNLRPAAASRQHDDVLAVERLRLHVRVEPDACCRRREVLAPLDRIDRIRD
jgi:hypothetical protein